MRLLDRIDIEARKSGGDMLIRTDQVRHAGLTAVSFLRNALLIDERVAGGCADLRRKHDHQLHCDPGLK